MQDGCSLKDYVTSHEAISPRSGVTRESNRRCIALDVEMARQDLNCPRVPLCEGQSGFR